MNNFLWALLSSALLTIMSGLLMINNGKPIVFLVGMLKPNQLKQI